MAVPVEMTSLDLNPKPSLLPLSNTPLCLPPFWLRAVDLLVVG